MNLTSLINPLLEIMYCSTTLSNHDLISLKILLRPATSLPVAKVHTLFTLEHSVRHTGTNSATSCKLTLLLNPQLTTRTRSGAEVTAVLIISVGWRKIVEDYTLVV